MIKKEAGGKLDEPEENCRKERRKKAIPKNARILIRKNSYKGLGVYCTFQTIRLQLWCRMTNFFAPLAPLASFFAEIFNAVTAQTDKIFSTTNDTHRTERLIIQGAILLVVIPLITMAIVWKFIISPMLLSGDEKEL